MSVEAVGLTANLMQENRPVLKLPRAITSLKGGLTMRFAFFKKTSQGYYFFISKTLLSKTSKPSPCSKYDPGTSGVLLCLDSLVNLTQRKGFFNAYASVNFL